MTPRAAALDRIGRHGIALFEAIRDLAATEAEKPAPRRVVVAFEGQGQAGGRQLRPKDAARFLGMHVATLRDLVKTDPACPKPVPVPGLRRGIAFREADLVAYQVARQENRRTA